MMATLEQHMEDVAAEEIARRKQGDFDTAALYQNLARALATGQLTMAHWTRNGIEETRRTSLHGGDTVNECWSKRYW